MPQAVLVPRGFDPAVGELRAAGVLTDEELATQKARILGT